jgi:hypothetical protein
MAAVTLSDAARALGFKSRSTLYRLRDSGDLAAYLLPPGPTGRQLLELEPAGLPPLREHVARLVRLQINTPRNAKGPRSDGRWGVVAGAFSDALADAGGLQLSSNEARAIAGALPAALGEAFGEVGLELLRVTLSDAGCWRAGPGTPINPNADREWWGDDGWGRWEPGEPLDDDAFWEHVGAIVAGMMGGPFAALSGRQAQELYSQLQDAIGSVEAGARFDPDRWAAASARSLLAYDEVRDGSCPYSREDLQSLAAGGRLPPDLQAQAEAALAAYATREAIEAELGS